MIYQSWTVFFWCDLTNWFWKNISNSKLKNLNSKITVKSNLENWSKKMTITFFIFFILKIHVRFQFVLASIYTAVTVTALCEIIFFALPYNASTTAPIFVITSEPLEKDTSSVDVSCINKCPLPWSSIPNKRTFKKLR